MFQVTDKHAQKDQSIFWQMPLVRCEPSGNVPPLLVHALILGFGKINLLQQRLDEAPFLCHLLYL